MGKRFVFQFSDFRFRIVFSALLFACTDVTAQFDDAGIAKKDSIQEVVITGMRPMYNLSSPTPVQSLKSHALEQISSLSVADAMRYFSGMQVKDYGGIGGLKTVNIRSMGSHHAGVFYDGIQLGNTQNGIVDLSKFSLDNIEAIDLYNAQKSDIFQSAKDYGSAGTIYLTTIKPKFAEGEKTRLKVQYRTALFEGIETSLIYGLTNPSVLWQQRLGGRISSSVSAEWINSNGKYRFDETVVNNDGSVAYDTVEIRRNSDINAFRAEAGLTGKINEGEWSAKAYFYDSERGIPGAAVRNASWRNQRMRDRNFFVQSSFCKTFGENYDFKVNGKYASDYMHFVGKDTGRDFDNVYRQQEVYLSAINAYRIMPVWKVSFSADFQYNELDANLVNFSYPQRYTGLTALATALDFDRLKIQASVLGTFVREEVKKNAASPGKNIFTPAVFASYKPFGKEEFRIRAFYKRIFRMPTFNDLYYVLVGMNFLKPEYVTQYDAGITYERLFKHSLFKRISFQTDLYYNRVTDKIIVEVTTPATSKMQNLGKVSIKGLDAALDAGCRIGQVYINTRLNYTWQQARDVTDSSKEYHNGQIPYVPEHNGSVAVSGNYKSWNINYSFIYAGERYSSSANIPRNYLQPWYSSGGC